MRITIEHTGQVIGFDHLASVFFRTDLTPIPVNLELTVKLNDTLEQSLKEGTVLLVGNEDVRVTIIKVMNLNTQIVVDDKRFKAISLIAVLSGCESMIDPLNKAVVLEGTNFAGAYRASGCKLKFSKDIPLTRFVCAYGSLSTIEVANCLQEESAMLFFDKGKLSVQRLEQFFNQEPVLTLDNSAIAWINNPKVEQHKVAAFVSVGEDGAIVQGANKPNSPVRYYPDTDARRLKNLSKVLVTRGTATRSMDMNINAGDIFLINDIKYVVLTAVHHFKSGALGGATANASRYWLATMSN
ncbi:hypothetical protein ACSNOU_18440 [Acinetobacter oleivorans]|uniref:hypothetical protein n=1 Tax=Acinetobacter oleivorans TaxID=1148157 RepID=UPI003F1CE6DB